MSHLNSTSPAILQRQRRAVELRAAGRTVREIAQALECSTHVAQMLLNRSNDKRIVLENTAWLAGLTHPTARTLLAQGYTSKADVKAALMRGPLGYDQPGVGPKTLAELARWVTADTPDAASPQGD